MPATFSTALPASATTTSPAKASETPSWSIVGRSAAMNQSETKAEPTPAGRQQPDRDGQRNTRRALARLLLARRRRARRGRPTRDRPPAGRRRRWSRSRARAGRRVVGRVGQPDEHDDEARDQQQRRRCRWAAAGGSASSPSGAWRAPTTMTRPSTSSALAKIEPTIDVCATTTSPARSAKMTTNSSGRLPSVDCSTPVTAGPKRSPTCSVASETTCASPASATVASGEGQQRRPSPRSARSRPPRSPPRWRR